MQSIIVYSSTNGGITGVQDGTNQEFFTETPLKVILRLELEGAFLSSDQYSYDLSNGKITFLNTAPAGGEIKVKGTTSDMVLNEFEGLQKYEVAIPIGDLPTSQFKLSKKASYITSIIMEGADYFGYSHGLNSDIIVLQHSTSDPVYIEYVYPISGTTNSIDYSGNSSLSALINRIYVQNLREKTDSNTFRLQDTIDRINIKQQQICSGIYVDSSNKYHTVDHLSFLKRSMSFRNFSTFILTEEFKPGDTELMVSGISLDRLPDIGYIVLNGIILNYIGKIEEDGVVKGLSGITFDSVSAFGNKGDEIKYCYPMPQDHLRGLNLKVNIKGVETVLDLINEKDYNYQTKPHCMIIHGLNGRKYFYLDNVRDGLSIYISYYKTPDDITELTNTCLPMHYGVEIIAPLVTYELLVSVRDFEKARYYEAEGIRNLLILYRNFKGSEERTNEQLRMGDGKFDSMQSQQIALNTFGRRGNGRGLGYRRGGKTFI